MTIPKEVEKRAISYGLILKKDNYFTWTWPNKEERNNATVKIAIPWNHVCKDCKFSAWVLGEDKLTVENGSQEGQDCGEDISDCFKYTSDIVTHNTPPETKNTPIAWPTE